jgi:pilus assembly protein Flp/PilA
MNHPRLNKFPLPVSLPACAGSVHTEAPRKTANTPSLRHLWHDESAQDLIEYALVAALVGLGSVVAMKALSNSIGNTFNKIGTSLTTA